MTRALSADSEPPVYISLSGFGASSSAPICSAWREQGFRVVLIFWVYKCVITDLHPSRRLVSVSNKLCLLFIKQGGDSLYLICTLHSVPNSGCYDLASAGRQFRWLPIHLPPFRRMDVPQTVGIDESSPGKLPEFVTHQIRHRRQHWFRVCWLL